MLVWIILFVMGPVALGFGVREWRLERLLRLKGVRVPGSVVRHVRRSTGSSDRPKRRALFAMVGFIDADGNPGELKVTSNGTRDWPVGREVPVVHLPGAPGTARIDETSERHAKARVFVAVGVGFTVIPLIGLLSGTGHG